jgi:hypothetical protein
MRDRRGRFQKGQSGNPSGRPKQLSNLISEIPSDALKRIYKVLHQAIKMPNKGKAMEYLQDEIVKEVEDGFLLQLAVKTLMSKDGWSCAMDILDRIFGKPRQTNDVSIVDAPQAIINFTDGNEEDKSE